MPTSMYRCPSVCWTKRGILLCMSNTQPKMLMNICLFNANFNFIHLIFVVYYLLFTQQFSLIINTQAVIAITLLKNVICIMPNV